MKKFKRINLRDLNTIKKVLEEEYSPSIGFVAEDPIFVGSILFMRDKVVGLKLEDAVRKLMPKPDTEEYNKIVERCSLRVTALRVQLPVGKKSKHA